jgi:membrane fusion protein, heavy metal efflux system
MNSISATQCCKALVAFFCLLASGALYAASSLGCVIEPERTAELGAPVPGVIDSMRVDRGDFVSAGQTLAVLRADVERANLVVAENRARLEADVAAAAANLKLAQQKRTRSEELHAVKFISKQGLEQAVAEHEVAVQKLAQAQEQIRMSSLEAGVARAQVGLRTIRSPFSGVVVERYSNPGERIEEKPMLKIAMIDPLRVELVVPGAHYGSIVAGTELSITPELPNAPAVAAKVTRIDRVLDPASNTFRVRLSMPNRGNKLPAGLRCKADLPGGAEIRTAAPKAGGNARDDRVAAAPPAPQQPVRTR